MKKIRNIVFDFGGVLLDWNPRYLYRDYFRDEEAMEHFLANVCTGEWNTKQDGGRPFAEAVRTLQAEHPSHHDAIRLFFDRWEEMLKGEIPEGVALLRRLKAEGYNVYGLTNWSSETIHIAYRKYDFFHLFEGVVVSGEEKLLKPDKRLFQVLLDRYKLDASESVFIDDNPANVEAARELGFGGVLFDNIESVEKRLSELLRA